MRPLRQISLLNARPSLPVLGRPLVGCTLRTHWRLYPDRVSLLSLSMDHILSVPALNITALVPKGSLGCSIIQSNGMAGVCAVLICTEFRQQRRRFCLASRRLLDNMWASVLHSRNTKRAQEEALSEEAQLLRISQGPRKHIPSSQSQATHG